MISYVRFILLFFINQKRAAAYKLYVTAEVAHVKIFK